MKKFLLILTIVSSFQTWAQNTKQVNHYQTPIPERMESFKITFKNPVSKYNYCKLGAQIENLENAFLLIKKSESEFNFDFGTFYPTKKSIIIAPNKKRTLTYKVENSNKFLVDSFKIKIAGIYKFPISGTEIKIGSFYLPAKKNSIKSEKLEVKLIKTKQTTQETFAVFEVAYYGDKVAIINEANLIVKIENGEEFSNENRSRTFNSQLRLLEKGKKQR